MQKENEDSVGNFFEEIKEVKSIVDEFKNSKEVAKNSKVGKSVQKIDLELDKIIDFYMKDLKEADDLSISKRIVVRRKRRKSSSFFSWIFNGKEL